MTTWVLLAGLPATGKSTLARALAARTGAVVLDKDRIREAMFPGGLTDYSNEQDEVCMGALLAAAAYLTAHLRPAYIFVDGRTFSRAAQIETVVTAAQYAGAGMRILLLTCSDATAAERLSRPDPGHPARNRNMALYEEVKLRFEPITRPHLALDTSTDTSADTSTDTSTGLDAAVEAALRYLAEPDQTAR